MLGPPRPPPAARLEPTCPLEALSYECALRAQAKHCCLQELVKFANKVPRKETEPQEHAHETQNAMRDERKTDSVLIDLPKIQSHRNKGLAAQYQRADRAGRPFCVAGANELSKQYGCRLTLTCVSRRVRKPAGPGRVKALGALWGQDASNRVVRACWAPDPPAKRCLPRSASCYVCRAK